MCLSCGCHQPLEDHGDARNIDFAKLRSSATAAGITDVEAARNIMDGVLDMRNSDVASGIDALHHGLLTCTVMTDMDNTLAFTNEELCGIINAMFGRHFDPMDFSQHQLAYYLNADQLAKILEVTHRPEYYTTMAPDLDAIRAIRAMNRHNIPIIVATGSPHNVYEAKEKWLHDWDVPYGTLVVGPDVKDEMAKKFGPDNPLLIIDDDPMVAYTMPRPGVQVIMPGRPYNGGEWRVEGGNDNENIHGWDDILTHLGVLDE